MLDASASVRHFNPKDGSVDNWALELEFFSRVVGAFDVGQDKTRVGAVVFSDSATLQFGLNGIFRPRCLSRAAILTYVAVVFVAIVALPDSTPHTHKSTPKKCDLAQLR